MLTELLFFLRILRFLLSILLELFAFSFSLEWVFYFFLNSSMKLRFFVDSLGLGFFRSVLMVRRRVLDFSKFYINGEYSVKGFTWLVLLFVGSMRVLIFSLNFVRIYLGWDGLGVISFLLVVFYEREKSLRAGIITALRNRVGDVLILFGIGCMFRSSGDWDFMLWLEKDLNLRLIVILARITKRAQIPFSAWLPAAIAAPTPVRALVHSSTLVTAGVYLLVRFELDFSVNSWFFYVGCFTGLVARLNACWEFDLKKVVALSTLRQLGIIIIRISLGLFKAAFFHLIRHAYFKALLFICVGLMIRSWGRQDRVIIGFLGWHKSLISVFTIIACSSLCGLFFMSGFFSKDFLFETILRKRMSEIGLVVYFFLIGLSVVYSYRILSLGLFNQSMNSYLSLNKIERVQVIVSITKLGILRLLGGWFLNLFYFFNTFPLILGFIKFFVLTSVLFGLFLGLCVKYLILRKINFILKMLYLRDLRAFLRVFLGRKVFSGRESLAAGWREQGGAQGLSSLFLNMYKKSHYSSFLYTFNLYFLFGLLCLSFS